MVRVKTVQAERTADGGPPASVYHCCAVVDNTMYVMLGLRSVQKRQREGRARRMSRRREASLVYALDLRSMRWSVIDPVANADALAVKSSETGQGGGRGQDGSNSNNSSDDDNVHRYGPGARCLASCVAVGRLLYVFGGYEISARDGTHRVFNGMWTFDTVHGVWRHLKCAGLSPDPRAGASMVYWGGRLWVYGGSQGRHVLFGDMFSFDLATNTWNMVVEPVTQDRGVVRPGRRTCHTATLVGENDMLVFGGLTSNAQQDDAGGHQVTADLLRCDLRTMRWTREKPSGTAGPSPRCCHAAIALGQVLLVACGGDLLANGGGVGSAGQQKTVLQDGFDREEAPQYDCSVYAYDARRCQWSKLSDSGLPRCLGLSAEYDPLRRRVLLFGGRLANGTPLSTLYALSAGPHRVPKGTGSGLQNAARTLLGKAMQAIGSIGSGKRQAVVRSAEREILKGRGPRRMRRQSIMAAGGGLAERALVQSDMKERGTLPLSESGSSEEEENEKEGYLVGADDDDYEYGGGGGGNMALDYDGWSHEEQHQHLGGLQVETMRRRRRPLSDFLDSSTPATPVLEKEGLLSHNLDHHEVYSPS